MADTMRPIIPPYYTYDIISSGGDKMTGVYVDDGSDHIVPNICKNNVKEKGFYVDDVIVLEAKDKPILSNGTTNYAKLRKDVLYVWSESRGQGLIDTRVGIHNGTWTKKSVWEDWGYIVYRYKDEKIIAKKFGYATQKEAETEGKAVIKNAAKEKEAFLKTAQRWEFIDKDKEVTIT